eukprot:TRINITY_DN12142_c0_g2_i31.p4 TRINITY_DN12142_c0_g2~~TRINITY_DN12142_c0_g2_i31.p4  ORF type:complete len:106 (+),score=22.77 TRINITY_DN12142_c0_g2_i31:2839-3156(+)
MEGHPVSAPRSPRKDGEDVEDKLPYRFEVLLEDYPHYSPQVLQWTRVLLRNQAAADSLWSARELYHELQEQHQRWQTLDILSFDTLDQSIWKAMLLHFISLFVAI